MRAIFSAWQQALLFFSPNNLFSFIKQSLAIFIKASIQVVVNYGWFFAIDAGIFLLFGDLIAQAANIQTAPAHSYSLSFLLLMLAQSLVWFLATSAYLLFVRKDDITAPKAYFNVFLFRYVQLLLIFSLAALMGVYILFSCGITKMPDLPWIIFALKKIFEYYIVFYWLNSSNRFVDFFSSIERAINLIFYNVPFFIIIIGLLWLVDFSMGHIVGRLLHTANIHPIWQQSTLLTLKANALLSTRFKVILIKYFATIVEYFWISLIFVFYDTKKRERYTNSMFEES
jgi:hypothetical protein